MRRTNHPSQQDPQKNPDQDEERDEARDEGGRGSQEGRGSHDLEDEDEQPLRVARRAGLEDDDAEEIDLADEDLDEVSELDEEQDAKKGDGPDA